MGIVKKRWGSVVSYLSICELLLSALICILKKEVGVLVMTVSFWITVRLWFGHGFLTWGSEWDHGPFLDIDDGSPKLDVRCIDDRFLSPVPEVCLKRSFVRSHRYSTPTRVCDVTVITGFLRSDRDMVGDTGIRILRQITTLPTSSVLESLVRSVKKVLETCPNDNSSNGSVSVRHFLS